MKLTYEELRQLVSLAGQERFCPTASMLMEKEQCPELIAHLQCCGPCRSRLADRELLDSELDLERLAEALNEGTLSRPAPGEVRPGQVWQLAPGLGGWGAYAQYYHTPQVLVLDALPYAVVRVAHVSTFGALGGRDDIFLTEDPSDGFAELWNVYSVPESWLDIHVGDVAQGVIAAGKLSRRLQREREPEEGSPQDIFRQQELYHSSHFAMKALGEVMRLTEDWEKQKSWRGGAIPFLMVEGASVAACCGLPPSSIWDMVAKDTFAFLEGAGWKPVQTVEEDGAFRLAAAASTASLSLNFGRDADENCCSVEYEDGRLFYSIDYIPAHVRFAVVLLFEGEPVAVQDEQGNKQLYVLIDSDAGAERSCAMSAQDFKKCSLRVFENR